MLFKLLQQMVRSEKVRIFQILVIEHNTNIWQKEHTQKKEN